MTDQQARAIADAAYAARDAERAALDGERRSPGVLAMRGLRAVAQSAATTLDDLLDAAQPQPRPTPATTATHVATPKGSK